MTASLKEKHCFGISNFVAQDKPVDYYDSQKICIVVNGRFGSFKARKRFNFDLQACRKSHRLAAQITDLYLDLSFLIRYKISYDMLAPFL